MQTADKTNFLKFSFRDFIKSHSHFSLQEEVLHTEGTSQYICFLRIKNKAPLPKETLLDTIILSQYILHLSKLFFCDGEICVFQFQYHEMLYIFYAFLSIFKNFL